MILLQKITHFKTTVRPKWNNTSFKSVNIEIFLGNEGISWLLWLSGLYAVLHK